MPLKFVELQLFTILFKNLIAYLLNFTWLFKQIHKIIFIIKLFKIITIQKSLIFKYSYKNMRSANSKEKTSTSTYSQNRLMKTQNPPKANNKQSLNTTQYRLPPSNKKIQSSKNTSTTTSNKQIPRQQIDYDIQNNMTQSKLIIAKQSLQLLKKKMNRTGMSRQKITSNNNIQTMQKTNYPVQSMKKIKSTTQKNTQNYEPTISKNLQSTNYKYSQNSAYNKDSNDPGSNKIQSKKTISNNQKLYSNNQKQQKMPLKKIQPPPQQKYYNQAQQIPITRKKDFNALLQAQLKKQQQQSRQVPNNSNQYGKNNQFGKNNKFQQDDQYGDPGELYECQKGCGRMFNAKVKAKHQKICQKVFQSKRKVFNTAAQRQLQQQGFDKAKASNKLNQTKKPQSKPQTKNKIPKWKLQSAQFRAGLKAANNVPLTAEQQTYADMQKDALIQCNYCGRKFNQTAGKRHIQYCEKKAKQMPRPSNGRKK